MLNFFQIVIKVIYSYLPSYPLATINNFEKQNFETPETENNIIMLAMNYIAGSCQIAT